MCNACHYFVPSTKCAVIINGGLSQFTIFMLRAIEHTVRVWLVFTFRQNVERNQIKQGVFLSPEKKMIKKGYQIV